MAKKANFNYAKGENRGGKILAEYLYLDEHGENYHLIQRTEFHQFPQSIWAVTNKDTGEKGWVPKQPKVKLPYQLPELLAAIKQGKDVYVCEGEKDADTVTAWGLAATTNPSGAGKWSKDLNKWFASAKNVYVLEDNDEPGRDHAAIVVRAMQEAGVPNVFLMQFNDLKEKEDVTDWVEKHGGTKAKFLKRVERAILCKDLPVVTIRNDDLPASCRQLEKFLVASKQPVLVRGGLLVQPIYTRWDAYSKDGQPRTTQTTVLRQISEINLHEIARKHACMFEKWDGRSERMVKCAPSAALLTMLLERGHWAFPKVKGCINAPTLRNDGSILREQGYDKTTGLWHYNHDEIKLDVPERPTRKDAEAGLKTLKALLKETPFADARLDLAVMLAAILTATCRGAFDTAPMFMFTAPISGTGKSYMVDIVSNIVHGIMCPVINLAGDREEREKRIGAFLIQGAPMISLDNLVTDIDDVLLNQLLTQSTLSIRMLGSSELVKCEWRGTLFATGNNVQIVGDLVRRGLTCTINANVPDPERREFKGDPVEDILKDRGKYLAAAFNIVRAFHFTKHKGGPKPLIGFEQWSHFIRDSLIWLGEEDVLRSQEIAKASDPNRQAVEDFIEIWKSGKVLKLNTIYRIADIIKLADETMANSNLRELLLTYASAGSRQVSIDPRRLGWWFRSFKGQVHLGHRVVQARSDTEHGHGYLCQKA